MLLLVSACMADDVIIHSGCISLPGLAQRYQIVGQLPPAITGGRCCKVARRPPHSIYPGLCIPARC